MCEARAPATGEPVKCNYRSWAKSVFDQLLEEKPWFGIEQEFFLMDLKTGKPLGFPADGEPMPQFQYYCAAGAENSFGRAVINDHLDACIYAGLAISGINAEVAPGQWEYQIGPAEGITAGDELCISRYILSRIGELHGYGIELHPKPVKGDWNGSGCHTNFSTKSMREEGGLAVIKKAMEALAPAHADHMAVRSRISVLVMTCLSFFYARVCVCGETWIPVLIVTRQLTLPLPANFQPIAVRRG
jgi:glutamine synthetase